MKYSIVGIVLLFFYGFSLGQIQIVITDFPENTPHDANIYIVGDFNDWNPGDPNYQIKISGDSLYSFSFPNDIPSFYYKITRGNWSSVEGRSSGQARTNRFLENGDQKDKAVYIQVESWEDLAGNPYSGYTLLLLLSAFQGILLIIALNGIQEKNQRANRILSLLLLMISFALVGRVSTYDRELFQWMPKLILLPELILFAYGPVFYFYIRNLLKLEPLDRKWVILHFIPFSLHIISYIPLFFRDHFVFIQQIVDRKIHPIFALVGGLALIFNTYYWVRARKALQDYGEESLKTQSFENLRYFNGVMWLNAICLIIWLFIYLISGLGWLLNFDATWIRENSTDTAWLVFSCTTYILGYFAINQPEIFKLAKVVEKYKDSFLSDKEMVNYKSRLKRVMEEDGAYLKPELTLTDLADLIGTNTHTLSRVINEGYECSFYDFINGFRIKEFIRLAQKDENRKETFLALAFQVGFNSKTTFNRAFKKETGMTPRAYLKEKTQNPELV